MPTSGSTTENQNIKQGLLLKFRHKVHLKEVQDRLTELAPYVFPGEKTPERVEKAKEYRSALHEHQHLRDGYDPWLYNMPP